MKELKGIITVLITPFTKNEEVDYEGLGANIEWLIDEGVHGLLALGSTGEYMSLTEEERYNVAEYVMERAGDRVPVVIGTTHETQKKVIEYSQHARGIGASGVMISPPPYCKPDMNEVYTYFKDINDAVDIPIIVYNNPWTTGVDITEETLMQIFSDCENIQYLKDSTGSVKRARDVQTFGPEGIKNLCGWDDLAYECFVLGFQGWISVASNVLPGKCIELYEKTVIRKDYKGAREVYNELLPVLRYLENSGKLVPGVKAMANMLSLAGGSMRGPVLPLKSDEEEKVRQLLIDLGEL